jgi:FAD synthetase
MRVMVFGTFDNLHPGHLNYLWQARHFGAGLMETGKPGAKKVPLEIIAVIARDKNVMSIKGRRPQQSERQRAAQVRTTFKTAGWSGKAVLGSLADKWAVLKKYRPDFIGLGYDQKVDRKKLKGALASAGLFCKIKRLKPYQPEKFKSSYYRRKE